MATKDPTLIVKALRDRMAGAGPGKGLLGAQAGNLIRTVDRDFNPRDYGVRNLREFIERHVSDLRVIAMSGPDPVYGFTDWPDLPREDAEDQPFDAWRVWVSPASHLAIGVARDGSSVRPARGEAPGAQFVVIAPAGEDVHRGLARVFLDELDDPAQDLAAAMSGALGESAPQWWRGWVEAIKTKGDKSLYSHWLEHRRRGLEKALEERLAEEGFENEASDKVMAAVRAQRRKPSAKRSPQLQSTSAPGRLPAGLRDLVLQIVPELSEAQLRELCLPLGAVLDALDIKFPDR